MKGERMNRRDSYADLDKWRTTCAQQKRRYYGSTAFAKNHHQPWTTAEIEAIMAREVTDRELSRLLGRSVGAIQTMRNKLKKGIDNGRKA